MSLAEIIGIIIFFLVWLVGIGSLIFLIKEFTGISKLRENAFRRGKVVMSFEENFPVSPPSEVINHVIRTSTGQYRFLNPAECIFSRKIEWFSFESGTPFPLKGYLILSGTIARIEWRLPLGLILFFIAWIIGMSIIPIILAMAGSISTIGAIGFSAGSFVFITAMYVICLSYEKRRAKKVVDEIKASLVKATGDVHKNIN